MKLRLRSLCVLCLACLPVYVLEAQSGSGSGPLQAPAFSASPKEIVEAAAAIKPEPYAMAAASTNKAR